jgi:hypothetical protein
MVIVFRALQIALLSQKGGRLSVEAAAEVPRMRGIETSAVARGSKAHATREANQRMTDSRSR